MAWQKSSLLGVVSLVVVLMIGAVMMNERMYSVSEVEYSSNNSVEIVEWYKLRPGEVTAYRYRLDGESMYGFTKRGSIGFLRKEPADGLIALKVYLDYNDPNNKRFGQSQIGWKYLKVVGYCASSKVAGTSALVELSHHDVKNGWEYAYSSDAQRVQSLQGWGYTLSRTVCYVFNNPEESGSDSGSGSGSGSPSGSSMRGIVVWMRSQAGLYEFEYRLYGETVPGFTKRGILAYLKSEPGSDRIALKMYSNSVNTEDRRLTSGGPIAGYTELMGTVGYCERTQHTGTVPLIMLNKDNHYAYITSSSQLSVLKGWGYENPGILCYVYSSS